jgi:hypothetical protein
LIATPAFTTATGVTPDYVIPAGFMNPAGGTVNFAGVSELAFGPFPSDPSQALQADGSFAIATPTNFAGQVGVLSAIDPGVVLIASVLPTSRSVTVGTTATAFATMINAGTSDGTDCTLAPTTPVSADFFFQTTDPATNAPVGTADAPVAIAAGASQSFVFGVTPSAAFGATEIELAYGCVNANPATPLIGINTLLVSASDSPIPDIVALAATVSNDGIVHLPGTLGTGFFTLASVNVGAGAPITVSVDTGATLLPLDATICESDPVTAACTNPAVPSSSPVSLDIAATATPTFAIFVTGSDTIDLDPATRRIFVRFRDVGGTTRGSTSVAVQTD